MSWKEFHKSEIEKGYYKKLQEKIEHFYSEDVQIFTKTFPPRGLIFRCFNETPLNNVRVVIIGQDPYHGKGQANGLAFAVNQGVGIPPSLRNIIKESKCSDTTLVKWAKQGVLLLNTTLMVQESEPMSCAKIGWETYTDNAIQYLLEYSDKDPLIFCLWGTHAQSKKLLISKYEGVKILESSHPSPLSAHISFNGCGHFSKINEILQSKGLPIIEW
jgi:uracil-DNA glycosylase